MSLRMVPAPVGREGMSGAIIGMHVHDKTSTTRQHIAKTPTNISTLGFLCVLFGGSKTVQWIASVNIFQGFLIDSQFRFSTQK
jgi:hypothetical protein